jgi:hypothetical protein
MGFMLNDRRFEDEGRDRCGNSVASEFVGNVELTAATIAVECLLLREAR